MKLNEIVEMFEKAQDMVVNTSSGKRADEREAWRQIRENLKKIIQNRLNNT